MLDDARDAAGVKRAQFFAPRKGCQESSVLLNRWARPIHDVVEVRRHLEQLLELVVQLAEQVVDRPITDEHDLDVEGNRFRIQRNRTDQAERLTKGFDVDFAGAQHSLQPFPGVRLHEHLACIDNQIAAIRFVQRARLDHREVGDQRAHLGLMFDTSDEIGKSRVVLIDHRRAVLPAMVNKDIDLVAAQKGHLLLPIRRNQSGKHWRGFLRWTKLIRMFDDVGLNSLQIADDLRQRIILAPDLVHQLADRAHHHFAVELLDLLLHIAAPTWHLLDHAVEIILQFGHSRFDRRPLFSAQLLIFLGFDHLTRLHRREREPGRRAHQPDIRTLGFLVEGLKFLFLAFLQALFDLLASRTIFIALQRRRHRVGELFDKLVHVVSELCGGPGG